MQRYTSEEVAKAYNFSVTTIRRRARLIGIKPMIFNQINQYLFSENEVLDIVNFERKTPKIPSIIYVHTTWEIRESKLNFM